MTEIAWYTSRKFDTNERMQAAGLLIHEGVMYIALNSNSPHNGVREIVRALFADELGGTFSPRSFHLLVDRNKLDVRIKLASKRDFQMVLDLINESIKLDDLRMTIFRLREIGTCFQFNDSPTCGFDPALAGFAVQAATYIISFNKGELDGSSFQIQMRRITNEILAYQKRFNISESTFQKK